MKTIDRRTFVQQTGIAGASLLALTFGAARSVADPDPPAGAAPPAAPKSALSDPDVHAFEFGGTEAYVIHDGAIKFPGIQPSFVPEADKAELEAVLKKNFLPADHLALSINVLVIKSKSGVMLFDAGAGSAFGGVGGKLVRGLARIGLKPADVKTIYVTHAHGDHIAGLVGDGNKPLFTSARIVASKTEVDFWTSPSPDLSGMRIPSESRPEMAATIRGLFGAVKSSLDSKDPGPLTPEVEMIAAPGHTPGHSLFRVTMGGETLLVIGDAVHSYALQFPHPEWTMAYDTDPAQAVKTRLALFKQASTDGTLLAGYHMPFPGLGHVREAGMFTYEWVPRPWVV